MIWVKTLWIFILAVAFAMVAALLADFPGFVLIHWLGWEVQTSVVAALSALALLLVFFILLRFLWRLLRGSFGI